MINKSTCNLALITFLFATVLSLSGCGGSGYTRTCSWCDDASQELLKQDINECNAFAYRQYPERSSTRKTGRIITAYGSTTCSTDKRGATTCTRGSDVTYPEEKTYDITDYGQRKETFNKCMDISEKNYRPKSPKAQIITNESSKPAVANQYNWNIETSPDNIIFEWTKVDDIRYISLGRNNIHSIENRRLFWVMTSMNENVGDLTVRSLILQTEIDCTEYKMRPLVGYAYPEPMGQGKLIIKIPIPSDIAEGSWKEISPSVPYISNICSTLPSK